MTGSLASRLTQLVQRELARLRQAGSRASVRRLAEDMGITHTYLNLLMEGAYANPSMEVIQAICKRLRTTPEYLWSGDRSVNVWRDIITLPEYEELSHPTVSRTDRFGWVLRYLTDTYSGHLSLTDIAREMGNSEESLRSCLKGQWEPTDHQLEVLNRLSGVPVHWLRFGESSLVELPDFEHLDAQTRTQYIDALSLAVKYKISPATLKSLIEAVGREKE